MNAKTLIVAISAIQFTLLGSSDSNERYVAHEWGTFTSVQGADGVPMAWNPLTSSELPGFVHDWSKPLGEARRHLTGFGGKTAFRTLQRMETPVIYFYAERPQTVDVTVKFPQGLITEWYPQVTEIGPSAVNPRPFLTELDRLVAQAGVQPHPGFAALDTRKGISDSHIRWAEVRIQPSETPQDGARQLLNDRTGSHYYAARETGADLLGVPVSAGGGASTEYERFLFYRGIGSFETPLQTALEDGESRVQIRNSGPRSLTDLIVLHVGKDEVEYTCLDELRPGEAKTVTVTTRSGSGKVSERLDDISRRMVLALNDAGLYPRESMAMVKTWRDSWFAEPGTRVIYLLPRTWTDQVLPLSLKPEPTELVRVMVGRAELITPATEQLVQREVRRFSEANAQTRSGIADEVRGLGLGRFLEPTVQRVAQGLQDRELAKAAWELLAAATPQQATVPAVAAR